jgi:hypothetical protein
MSLPTNTQQVGSTLLEQEMFMKILLIYVNVTWNDPFSLNQQTNKQTQSYLKRKTL